MERKIIDNKYGVKRERDRDRVERARLAAGPKASLRERAVAFARKRGEVRTKEFTSIGIPRCHLSPMCGEGLLEKVATIAIARYPKGTVSRGGQIVASENYVLSVDHDLDQLVHKLFVRSQLR